MLLLHNEIYFVKRQTLRSLTANCMLYIDIYDSQRNKKNILSVGCRLFGTVVQLNLTSHDTAPISHMPRVIAQSTWRLARLARAS